VGFRDYLRQATASCDICHENKVDVRQIKVALQPYDSDFAIYDTVLITRNAYPTVETDIEVTYRTEYPYGMFAGKGAEFDAEQKRKEKAISKFLQDKLPVGTVLRPYHLHYSPDKHDPGRVALHIHALKRTEDLDEAVHVAKQLVELIHPQEIEEAIQKED
jgi:hypothetical protein